MHIRDGILSPEVCVMAGAMSLAAIGFSLRQMRKQLEDRAIPMTGMVAALIFAGQMVNFPLPGLPVSGHLLGGVLASVLLGPWGGCVAIAMVLGVQAVLFSDGGLLSLGANILNMGVLGSWGGYVVYATLQRGLRGKAAPVAAAAAAAWLSVIAAAQLFCVEFLVSSRSAGIDPRGIITLMVFYHAVIGVGEGLITGIIVSFVLARRPDLILRPEATGSLASAGRFTAAGLVAALAVAALLAPFKSDLPDGLDAVSQRMSFDALEIERPALLLDDYAIPAPEVAFWPGLPVSLAGILGTLVVFGLCVVLVAVTRRKSLTAQITGSPEHG